MDLGGHLDGYCLGVQALGHRLASPRLRALTTMIRSDVFLCDVSFIHWIGTPKSRLWSD